MTVGERLVKCYANLAMAHAAVTEGAEAYQSKHYMIRARLRSGLLKGTMQFGSLLDDERVKMRIDRACAYCGSLDKLTLDHLVPRAAGGPEAADNAVWACRSCNSSKGDVDFLAWMQARGRFPPLLLLRRYVKLAVQHFTQTGQWDADESEVAGTPFNLDALRQSFPPPRLLVLWVPPRSPDCP